MHRGKAIRDGFVCHAIKKWLDASPPDDLALTALAAVSASILIAVIAARIATPALWAAPVIAWCVFEQAKELHDLLSKCHWE